MVWVDSVFVGCFCRPHTTSHTNIPETQLTWMVVSNMCAGTDWWCWLGRDGRERANGGDRGAELKPLVFSELGLMLGVTGRLFSFLYFTGTHLATHHQPTTTVTPRCCCRRRCVSQPPLQRSSRATPPSTTCGDWCGTPSWAAVASTSTSTQTHGSATSVPLTRSSPVLGSSHFHPTTGCHLPLRKTDSRSVLVLFGFRETFGRGTSQ